MYREKPTGHTRENETKTPREQREELTKKYYELYERLNELGDHGRKREKNPGYHHRIGSRQLPIPSHRMRYDNDWEKVCQCGSCGAQTSGLNAREGYRCDSKNGDCDWKWDLIYWQGYLPKAISQEDPVGFSVGAANLLSQLNFSEMKKVREKTKNFIRGGILREKDFLQCLEAVLEEIEEGQNEATHTPPVNSRWANRHWTSFDYSD